MTQIRKHGQTDRAVTSKREPAPERQRRQASHEPTGHSITHAPTLSISPRGVVHLDDADVDVDSSLPAPVTARIVRAFEAGAAAGLLHLAAAELETSLPPTLSFGRELAHRYLAALCSSPERLASAAKLALPAPSADELAALVVAAPLMRGAEYLSEDVLALLWSEIDEQFWQAVERQGGTARDYLAAHAPLWHGVGRVHFHLAENKADPDAPFAFLATYTTRVSNAARLQHRPLGKALEEFAGARNRQGLLALLEPLQRAAETSAFLKQLVDGGDVFHPLRWTPRDAYRFLVDLPTFEAAGVVVRVPDWWKARRPPRPKVRVTVGASAAGGLGVDSLLDFHVELSLDGVTLSEAEWRSLASTTDGLALVRGQWVEVDREKLAEALAQWKRVERHAAGDGLSFIEGMRLLAGARLGERGDTLDAAADRSWSDVVAGPWLAKTLAALREPGSLPVVDPGPGFRGTLRAYQDVGVRWLSLLTRLGLGACLADDMGLGKTIQVLALLAAERTAGAAAGEHESPHRPSLLVAPASLLPNWQSEIERFAPSLRTFVAHASATAPAELAAVTAQRLAAVDLVITTYGSITRLPWIEATSWNLVVVDEAQAIKNPGTRQARAVKALTSRARIALTGTPIENRSGDLWSLFDFLCPGLLGSAKAFGAFAKQLAADPTRGYAPLRNLVRPYVLRRLKTDPRVISDLPEKVEMKTFCTLTKVQAVLYQQAVDELAKRLREVEGIERRGLVLAFLTRFKQICNHPSQWLGDGAWAPEASGKLARLRELADEIAARQEKALVFTQFREMTEPLATFLAAIFGRPGAVLHGGTSVRARRDRVAAFQEDEGPPFFVLSLKAGGTGLNLTAASHVIHFDRWWNPAVENQATDRAFRIGQRKNVLVHKLVCRGTVEEHVDALIASKQGLADDILDGSGEVSFTEMSNEELMKLVALDIHTAMDAT